MHGVPVAFKDIYDTTGMATAAGSAILKDRAPAEDAFTVRRLRDAGAVVLGKLTTYEFALGGSSFDLPWPPARNPWNLALDPAGSSSGSGAATAAGYCLGAMGSDTGGSIRGPAAWCGLAGLKPTYGLLSRRGVFPLSFSLDHAGPLCWTAEDCALMMQALAAHDPLDRASADPGPIDFASEIGKGVRGLRIGVVRQFFEREIATDASVIAALEQALIALSKEGASVSDAATAPFAEYNAVGMLISRAEAFAIHGHWLKTTPEKYGAYGRSRLLTGAFISAADYVNALRRRTRLIQRYVDLMRTFDILVFPTASSVAEPLGVDSMNVPVQKSPFFSRAFNVLGGPALSICSGFSSDGLPLSLQVMGRPFEDALVLRVGDMLERALGTRDRRPPPPSAAAKPEVAPPVSVHGAPSGAFLATIETLGLPRLSDPELAALESAATAMRGSAALVSDAPPAIEEPPSVLRLAQFC